MKQLTLKEVAGRMNIAPESLTRAISGNPTLSTLKNLADTLDVDITDLFYRTKPSSEVNAIVCWGTQALVAENLNELKDIIHQIEAALNTTA